MTYPPNTFVSAHSGLYTPFFPAPSVVLCHIAASHTQKSRQPTCMQMNIKMQTGHKQGHQAGLRREDKTAIHCCDDWNRGVNQTHAGKDG